MTGGALTGTAAADEHGDESETEDSGETEDVDSPEGFSAELLAPHATFPDDVAAEFRINYDDEDEREVATLDDVSNVVAKVTWKPGDIWLVHPPGTGYRQRR